MKFDECSAFANELSNARKLSNWKQYVVGRSSDATFADAFARQEAILRCLGGFDPTGEVCYHFLVTNLS